MKKALRLISWLACLGLGLALLTAGTSLAANESLTVSPLKGEFKLLPGQQVGSAINIKNSGEAPIDVEVYAEVFSVKNEQYDQEFNRPANQLAASNWISFDKTNYPLEPKQQQVVNYHVKVPANAEPGGHYVAIISQTKSDNGSKAGVSEIRRVATLLYFEISGQITKTGSIKSFLSDYWQKNSPIKTKLVLHNSGNTHYRAEGSAVLKDLFGRQFNKTIINGLLMPGSNRLFEPEVAGPKIPGLYRLEASIDFPQGGKATKLVNVLYLPAIYIYSLGAIIIVTCIIIFLRLRKKRG